MRALPTVLAISAIGFVFGCGPSSDGLGSSAGSGDDIDGDGFRSSVDCDDNNAAVYPGAAEICDFVDNDCDGLQDEGGDGDGDGFPTCRDCDDNNAAVYPGAPESDNGIDDDCNGQPDDNLSNVDDDGDGYSDDQGDCNDNEPLVSPSAVEIATNLQGQPEGVDNDCDGQIDEALAACDSGLGTSANDFAKAMDLCDFVESANFNSGASSSARRIASKFGNVYTPHAGASMVVLSTGKAIDKSGGGWVSPNGGTEFYNSGQHPDPQGNPGDGCGSADESTVNDIVELTLNIEVPSNAQALTYDFNFMSAEFPEFVCTEFDDTFVAILESTDFTGNISFDDAGRPVTINVGFFDVCPVSAGGDCAGDSELAGTGYEGSVGGGTGWLTTTAPVTPGEIVTLRFVIFDEGDSSWDSLVLIDNFRWEGTPVDGPITVERKPYRDPSRGLEVEGETSWQIGGR